METSCSGGQLWIDPNGMRHGAVKANGSSGVASIRRVAYWMFHTACARVTFSRSVVRRSYDKGCYRTESKYRISGGIGGRGVD